MRTIDVDAFLAEITRELADAHAETDSEKDKLFGMGYIIKRLTEAPRADRHAKWNLNGTSGANFLECSGCGEHIKTSYRPDVMKFCPFCGACMDGGAR